VTGRPDPIETWLDVSARAARGSGYRAALARRRWSAGASIAATTVAVAIVIAGLALRPSANNGSSGPVIDRAEDGTFRLELVTPRGTYRPGDPISPEASVTYLGPDESIVIHHAESPVQFRIEEVGGLRAMGGGSRLVCSSSDLAHGVPLELPFSKAGSPTADFDQAWYEDQTLSLPVGTWKIVASIDLGVTDCGGTHQLSVSNVITVIGDALPSVVPSHAPSLAPSPTLSADAAVALQFVRKYEDALTTDHPDVAWRFLSPWSQRTVGSATTFYDAERRLVTSLSGRNVVGAPSQDPDLLDPVFLGARAADVVAVADPDRTFVVSVRHLGVDGAATATENLVVATIDGDWRIWIEATPGLFGAWPYPGGCSAFGLSDRRCEAIIDAAASQAGVDRRSATSIWLMPEPGCGDDPLAQGGFACVRTTSFVAGVRFDVAGGDPVRTDIFCGAGRPSLVCTETPRIEAIDFHNAGYWDVPCSGEAPDGCASPLPSLGAGAAGSGTELRIDTFDLPVGPVGHREVDLGRAVLVDGIVQEARFSIADQVQAGFLLTDGTIRLELRSTIAGRPRFDNAYDRGTFDGPEEVHVVLVFDVAETSPDAVIHVTDVLVR
jgi:hypothetical protein